MNLIIKEPRCRFSKTKVIDYKTGKLRYVGLVLALIYAVLSSGRDIEIHFKKIILLLPSCESIGYF